ncbi:signal transduction histidine kinase [Methylophaga lonarensis MPL]|uniref:histidine kinase n=1 Tax=Methylophaga lonarensis MPL TaxID=1286106 RepID=M7PSQ2_9GAMM|nr:sensor histidine kinase [Methylophaga lonarensis]EMR13484.1 signal transduction histidine kinase [Methylophaga lonarensis MPL]
MSLTRLINLRILLSVVVIMCLGSFFAIWQARQSVEHEVQSSFNLAVQLFDLSFKQFAEAGQSEQDWLRHLSALRETRHLNLALENDQGEQVALFTEPTEDFYAHLPRWYVYLVMTEPLAVDYMLTLDDGRIKRLVLSADPMDEIDEAWQESQAYFWSVIAMIIVIFVAINLVFHSMLKAVRSILSGLRQIESGQYGLSLPQFNISEFDAISTEINSLSSALNTARNNNQALARHSMQIQEQERRNMSRELHDEMGQSLTAIKAMAVAVRQPAADREAAGTAIIDVCNHLSGVVRSMMRTLHPLSLTDLGLGATLTDLINEWQRRDTSVSIQLGYDERVDTLHPEQAIHVYRIVQECLTNVVRHANATEVIIAVNKNTYDDGRCLVSVVVEDNGIGKQNNNVQGFGLLAMRERVESMGGDFKFESVSGVGVRVEAWIPYTEKQEQNESEQD